MNLRQRRPEPLDINVTPLIDVVFLLLIFFMVSTTFEKQTRIEIALPEAETSAEVVPEEEKIDIVIDQAGRYYVNDGEVVNTDPATLRGAINKLAAGRTDLPVAIKADGQAPYQSVMTALDVLSQLGLTQMSFIARKLPASE